MRPHFLRFAGIGAYPDLVEINFDDLNQMGLYLIVGPTGAGKTTLLDAMTYALYGRVSQDRENALVSAHGHSKPAMIEFEFSQGDRRYVVHREPAAPGKQVATNKQWIKEFDATGSELSGVTGVRPVNEKAKSVVGLSAEEFMQVILLPQGKFQDFLLAKGSDKQKILQTIFGTGVYRRVVDRLETVANDLHKEVAAAKEELIGKQAVIDSAMGTLLAHPHFAGMPDHAEDLDAAVAFIAERLASLEIIERTTRENHTTLASDLVQATKEQERFDKGQELSELRLLQESEAESVAAARSRVEHHRRAEPVVVASDTRRELLGREAGLAATVADLRCQLSDTAACLVVDGAVASAFVAAIPTATPASLSQEFVLLQRKLADAAENHRTLADVIGKLDACSQNSQKVAERIGELTGELQSATAESARCAGELAAARESLKGLPDAEAALRDLNDLAVKANVSQATEIVQKAATALSEAQATYDAAEKQLRRAQALRTQDLAGVLAAELSAGEPCPVCGSTEHPHKAVVAADEEYDVDAAGRARDAANTLKIGAERDLADAQGALDVAKGFEAQLPALDEQERIRSRCAELRTLALGVDDLQAQSEAADTLVIATRDAINEAERKATALEVEERNLAAQRKSLEEALAGVGSVEDIDASLDACAEISELLRRLEANVNELAGVEGRLRQADEVCARELSLSGFADEESARACGLDPATLEELDRMVEAFDARGVEIGKLHAAVGDAPLPGTRPDVADLTTRLDAARQAADAAAEAAGAARTSNDQILRAKDEMAEIGPEFEEKTNRARKASEIAFTFDRGAGGADGQLSLEVWVQRTLFEEVCLVANEQLRSLSNHRYSLTLEQEEGGVRRRRGSGLDLYVFDSHTGKTRPVQTLSGGETFLASLALALALAEVVQRQAGGIELPCLFIDEGFGGLDLEILDLAMEVLGNIQASGRTVGIITHVETMQQQLPIGIKVHKSDRGSTLEVLAS